MAGRGPAPKIAATRQRRNASPGARTLAANAHAATVPALPQRGSRIWDAQTLAWWEAVWTSPMSSEYTASDVHGLYRLAELVDRFWRLSVRNPERVKLMTEIRQQEARFGLSPQDRRRLQWEIEKGEEAEERTQQRASRRAAAKRAQAGDPREFLKPVP